MGASRWALRVNPSSGNLHPTEAYVVVGPLASVADTPAVYHYSPDRHALELRCRFDGDAWLEALPPAVVETDSMLLLARARRSLASGALSEAVRIMRDAEPPFP